MASITIQLDDNLKGVIEKFSWINWSEIGRNELLQKEIFERYLKKGMITEEDSVYCEKADWHPVDELPLKESFVKKLKAARKEKHIPMTLEKLDKLLGLK